MSVLYFFLMMSIIAVDRYTKLQTFFLHTHDMQIFRWLWVTPTFNSGITCSIFATSSSFWNAVLLCSITLFLLIFFIWMIFMICNQQVVLGHICIFSGAISNLYDRYVYGAVIDFICVQLGAIQFPVFNFADIAIVFGALICFLQIREES